MKATERAASTRRWREQVREAEGQVEPFACVRCKTPIEGVAYRAYTWRRRWQYTCAACASEWSRPRRPEDVEACVICGRETTWPYVLHGRRDITWCGERSCRAAATRLSRRVPPMEPRVCECCGESFEPSRSDARFCSTACRARSHRERVAAEPPRQRRDSTTSRSRSNDSEPVVVTALGREER